MWLKDAGIFINLNQTAKIQILAKGELYKKLTDELVDFDKDAKHPDKWLAVYYITAPSIYRAEYVPLSESDLNDFNRQILFFNYDKG